MIWQTSSLRNKEIEDGDNKGKSKTVIENDRTVAGIKGTGGTS